MTAATGPAKLLSLRMMTRNRGDREIMQKGTQLTTTASKPRRHRAGAAVATLAVAAAFALVGIRMADGATVPAGHAKAAPRATAAAGAAGASTPFTSYEAESGTLGGGAQTVSLTAAPTNQYATAALEASGHAYVHLSAAGQSVQWTNNTGQSVSAINVRASIPDSAAGGGITATLDLYVNGVLRQPLNLNSKQSWLYEGNNNYNGNDQNPADGDSRDFFDESSTFITGAPVAPGSTISLKKDAANSAAFYDIDSVDVENPPAPLAQPANSISITGCGAVADDNPTNGSADSQAVDSTGAIQNCINQAQSQGKILWIPQGTFYLKGTNGLQAKGITIAGAGPWYSTVYRSVPLPNSVGLGAVFSVTSCTVENFHIDSNATSRATVDGAGGAMDTTGTNWVADNIWSQHVESGFWASGSGGTVKNSRLTAIWADGINLNNVSLNGTTGSNLTATNNYVRGTGDDAMAINSVAYNDYGNGKIYYTAMSGVTLTHNSLIAPWGGKGIGIYGGSGHLVQDNYISDTARYIGLGAGRFGVNGSDLLGATVSGNTVLRSGGNAYSQGQPAVQIGNGGDGQNSGTVSGVTVSGNTVSGAVYDAVGFSTSTGTRVQDNTIVSPWRGGIVISPPFYPAPTGSATVTGNSVTGLRSGASAFTNNSGAFTVTASGNSWQGGTSREAPFGGSPAAVPGTVQAENYDTGGQGVAYSVASANGSGNGYRPDGIDLETTADSGGGYDLGWTGGAQWFRYTVDAAAAGTYTVSFRVAAPAAVTDGFHLSDAGGKNLTGAVNIPATGGFQNWTNVTATVTLPAGRQVLTLAEDVGGWNANSATFTAK
ncbi:carbohydrate-binding protein [Streptomyces sp. NBC_01190]|uniref:carbohydrate-binding protein n=1 Tax=Streptomyces sp. NBC_01190 TaxID=2903767 RepID=UPI0038670843|nr:carbohydrate-binding protein [Streptomyces sp. NBC_01190]